MAFPQGNSKKTLVLSGYPISFIIETKRTIERWLIHTLRSVGSIIPRLGIAIRPRVIGNPGGASVHARSVPDLYVSGRPKAARMRPVRRATLSPLMTEIT